MCFKFVKDKVEQKIKNWNAKLLSRAGKAVLIKSVAQTIPSYIMSCFMLPKTLCKEIECLMNKFWWKNNSTSSRGIHWLSWDKMNMAKLRGGLGFRSQHGYNIAMLGKHIWNFMNKPNTLVARVFKAKYFSNSSILHADRSRGSSFIWSGIWSAKEELKKDFRWVIGNGESKDAGTDPWLRTKHDFMVDIEGRALIGDTKVCHFFKPNLRVWDEEKVKRRFSSSDAEIIYRCVFLNMIPWTVWHECFARMGVTQLSRVIICGRRTLHLSHKYLNL